MKDLAATIWESEQIAAGRQTNGTHPEPPKADFPLFIFPPPFQAFIKAVAESTETPIDAVAFAVLGMVSACYGTHVRVHVKQGYTTWCHDYCTLVGSSSFGKTPIFKLVQPPLRKIEERLQSEKAAEVQAAKARIVRLEIDQQRLTKAYKGDGPAKLESELQKIAQELEDLRAVALPQVIVSDVTPEVLVKIQSQNGDAASMVSGETPLWGKLCGRSTGKLPDIESFLSSYDGEFYRVDRITRAANCVNEARLAILGGTQDAVMADIHTRPDLMDRGFVARFTFCKVPNLGEAHLSDRDVPVTDAVRAPYDRELTEWGLHFRRELAEPFRMSPGAAERYRNWRNTFKRRHRLDTGDLHDIAPFARKLENKALRWAGLLHPLWTDTPEILQFEDIGRGLALVDFAIENYRAVQDLVAQGPVEAVADAVKAWCKQHIGQTVKLRMLRKRCAAFRKAPKEVQEAVLIELEDEGILSRIENTNEGGYPSPAVAVL